MTTAPNETTITTEQRVKITAAPKTHAGNPADVDGVVLFFTDDPQLLALVAGEPNSRWFNAPGTVGDITVTISADADLGEGVKTITDTVVVHVVHPQAENLGVAVGQPEDKPVVTIPVEEAPPVGLVGGNITPPADQGTPAPDGTQPPAA